MAVIRLEQHCLPVINVSISIYRLKRWHGRMEEGKLWLSYNSPDYLFKRFAIDDRAKVKKNITGALAKLSQSATQP
ncbi:MAG: hypothetical protein KZQ66_21365 [Candidatus Thiodiazotropha sp. (ex Lucinoma aequizonata)]|nr:hypothetical protein [Candidatus Thiodiazotropha sp. (ex Lucinoma aequizonata)]